MDEPRCHAAHMPRERAVRGRQVAQQDMYRPDVPASSHMGFAAVGLPLEWLVVVERDGIGCTRLVHVEHGARHV